MIIYKEFFQWNSYPVIIFYFKDSTYTEHPLCIIHENSIAYFLNIIHPSLKKIFSNKNTRIVSSTSSQYVTMLQNKKEMNKNNTLGKKLLQNYHKSNTITSTIGTDFEKKVWNQLCTIPFGTVTSYSHIAEDIGCCRNAARAIGTAIRKNPFSIFVPCHRVVPMAFFTKSPQKILFSPLLQGNALNALVGSYAGNYNKKREILASEYSNIR